MPEGPAHFHSEAALESRKVSGDKSCVEAHISLKSVEETMKAQTLQKLVAYSGPDIVSLARQLQLGPLHASRARTQFLRQLSGRCSVCDKPTGPTGFCQRCQRRYPQSSIVGRYPIRTLERLKPGSLLTQATCRKCQRSFPITVSMVLHNLDNNVLKMPDICTRCCNKERYEDARKLIQSSDRLTFRPFRTLRSVKTGQKGENRANNPG